MNPWIVTWIVNGNGQVDFCSNLAIETKRQICSKFHHTILKLIREIKDGAKIMDIRSLESSEISYCTEHRSIGISYLQFCETKDWSLLSDSNLCRSAT